MYTSHKGIHASYIKLAVYIIIPCSPFIHGYNNINYTEGDTESSLIIIISINITEEYLGIVIVQLDRHCFHFLVSITFEVQSW